AVYRPGRGSPGSYARTSGVADARIEPGVEQVGHQIADHHRASDQQDDPLHDRVVTGFDALEQQPAQALVDEDRLDEDRAAEDEPGRDGELGEQWQDGIAS